MEMDHKNKKRRDLDEEGDSVDVAVDWFQLRSLLRLLWHLYLNFCCLPKKVAFLLNCSALYINILLLLLWLTMLLLRHHNLTTWNKLLFEFTRQILFALRLYWAISCHEKMWLNLISWVVNWVAFIILHPTSSLISLIFQREKSIYPCLFWARKNSRVAQATSVQHISNFLFSSWKTLTIIRGVMSFVWKEAKLL